MSLYEHISTLHHPHLFSLFVLATITNPAHIMVTPPMITLKPENLCLGIPLM